MSADYPVPGIKRCFGAWRRFFDWGVLGTNGWLCTRYDELDLYQVQWVGCVPGTMSWNCTRYNPFSLVPAAGISRIHAEYVIIQLKE
ncbi:hypothetical protein LCL98_17300 [Rossellomorea aquimaris]|nr:hypothetical protein [Rossellomorea aquimaris]